VDDLLDQAEATGLPIHLFFTGGVQGQLPLSWQQIAAHLSLQQGEDLGARMAHAFATCFQEGERVVLIGSDIPDMGTEILLKAARPQTGRGRGRDLLRYALEHRSGPGDDPAAVTRTQTPGLPSAAPA
jgi:hypothetical protein